MLIPETRFTDKNYVKIHDYNFYHTQHPTGKAHGGTGIIIKSIIKLYELPSFQKDYLQATNVAIEKCHGTITTSAVYISTAVTISTTSPHMNPHTGPLTLTKLPIYLTFS